MKKILVVDDSTTVRLYYRHVLESLGHTVAEAQNGLEALEKIAAGAFDLFLVDVNMPKMDGYRLLEELRRMPDTAAIPAAMISTEAAPEDKARAFAAGANLYVWKPVRPEDLAAYVELMTGDQR